MTHKCRCTCCKGDNVVYELNTYSKNDAKDNIIIIKNSLTDIKSSLNKFIEDVGTLNNDIDTDGYDTSLESFATLQTNFVNELKNNSNKLLSNNSHAIPLKINKNSDVMGSVEKDNKARRNYILGNLKTVITAKNTNRDNFIFDNSTDNKIALTIGNKSTNPQISVGSIVLIENTTNYNGFYQTEVITTSYSYGETDAIYGLYAYGLTNKAIEYHSQNAKISVYNSAVQEVTVGATKTTTKSYILGTTGTAINANSNSVSSITLSCNLNGQITVTAGGGTPFNGFDTTYIIKIEGSSISSYNGYWLVDKATSNTVIKLYGGNTTTFSANSFASNNTTSSNPVVILTPYTSNTDISSTVSVGASQTLTKNIYIGSAGTVIQGGVTTNVNTLAFSETNGIITVTADAGTPFTLNFGDICRIQATTNYNYYGMVVDDISSSNTLKIYIGSTLGVADEAASSTPTITPYTSNMIAAAVSIAENKQFSIGTVTVANITADDNANSYLQFKNRTNERITLEICKGLSSPSISVGSIVKIENTTNYNGSFVVNSVDTEHTSLTNGIYTLFAPRLKDNTLEKYYSLAKVSIYTSSIEQPEPKYNDIIHARTFSVNLDNNIHILFYVPSLSVYFDNGYLFEILFNEKKKNFDLSKVPKSTTGKYRITGKTAIPSNSDELKLFYNQIISTNKDEDKINPNYDINELIKKFNKIIHSIKSISNASYLN